MHLRLPVLSLLVGLTLSGCALGPDYVRVTLPAPPEFAQAHAYWKPANPREPDPKFANWWELFGDAALNQLVSEANANNPGIAAAEALHRRALALLGNARAAQTPTLDASISDKRGQSAGDRSVANTARIQLASRWEADLWGRISRSVEAADANARASEYDLAGVRLSIQATLVQAWLQLRINEAHQALLARTLSLYRRSLEITRNRHEAGIASQADVAQAQTQLYTAEAQATDLGVQHAQLRHAIATLVGKLPGEVSIAPGAMPSLPQVPPRVPSTLLERRPDIAAAERRVAAANAGIGVAQSAFFPEISLGATGGYEADRLSGIIQAGHRFWSLGPALALSVFDGGARAAQKATAIAAFDQAAAQYRQTALLAFQEVEDQLATLAILQDEKRIQAQATRSANAFLTLTNNQYLAGTVSFLNVATAQASALSAERASLDVLNRQLLSTVALVKALGGALEQE